jgi:5,8-dihydroxy-2-naphthoate synthase
MDMGSLRLAYSPCPNDTTIFHAWVHGLVPGAPPVEERLADIDVLNALALQREVEIVKVSMHAFAHLQDDYALLHSGGALGRGCGPLVVARKDSRLRPAPSVGRVAALVDRLGQARVAIPGELTTAALLLGLFTGGVTKLAVMPFEQIMPAVAAGAVDAGVIIHEGRFTYGAYGLRRLVDLGEWWEESSGLPIPLGGIAVLRALESTLQARVEEVMRESVEYADRNPDAALEYVKAHAQEMDSAVCRAHVELYVNEFTHDYGSEGERAIRRLLDTAAELGLTPRSEKGLFWDE